MAPLSAFPVWNNSISCVCLHTVGGGEGLSNIEENIWGMGVEISMILNMMILFISEFSQFMITHHN